MDKKSLGIFLTVLGVIFLGISGVTIWSLFFDYDLSKGVLIILSIPLMVFSFTTIFFGFYLISQTKLGVKVKGLILIIDGMIPVISSIYAMADTRFDAINDLRILVLLPLTLVGIFIIIYGVFLIGADMYLESDKMRKRANQILGIISIAIGIINIIAFVIMIVTEGEQPIILTYFGIHLIIKKIEDKKKYSKKKK